MSSLPGNNVRQSVGQPGERPDDPGDRHAYIRNVFSRLRHVEQAITGGSVPPSGRFADGRDWIVKTKFARDCFWERIRRPGHQPILAGVSLRGLGRLLRSSMRYGTIEIETSAAAANVRKRVGLDMIRAFYPYAREPLTAKVSSSGASRLQLEVTNRHIVSEAGCLQVPRIRETDFSACYPFLIEEMVRGRLALHRKDQALLIDKLLPNLQQHYTAFGLRGQPFTECFDAGAVGKIEEAVRQIPWEGDGPDQRQFMRTVEQLAKSEKCLCTSFCHGDLTSAHVVVSDDNRVMLLDWESAGIQPVTFDMINMLRTFRKVNRCRLIEACESVLTNLSQISNSDDLLQPAEQIFWASLRRVVIWDKFSPWFELQGKDPKMELKRELETAREILMRMPPREAAP